MSNARNGQQPGQQGRNGQQGQNPQPGSQPGDRAASQSGQRGGQPGNQGQRSGNSQQAGAQPGNQPGQQSGQAGQQSGGAGAQQSGTRSAQAGGGASAGQRASFYDRSGDIRTGGGASGDGPAWNNVNTGNNTYGQPGQRPTTPTPGGNPADTERTFQQSLRELIQLRGMVGGDPQAAKDVADLTRRMSQLDPRRFSGNPAMVEQMHREMLAAVDRLELRLQRDDSATEARTGKPSSVPAGYGDSVADYYRRLSAKP